MKSIFSIMTIGGSCLRPEHTTVPYSVTSIVLLLAFSPVVMSMKSFSLSG